MKAILKGFAYYYLAKIKLEWRRPVMTKKQEPQMMICPTPEGCPEYECEHRYAHEYQASTENSWGCDTPCTCPSCIPYVAPQPEPEMPLLTITEVSKRLPDDHEKFTSEEIVALALKQQRDADMAWLPAHDQQVRKAFAEECIRTMPINNAVKKQRVLMVAHLRAMAERGTK